MKRRNTHQREAVLQAITGFNHHMTAEDVKTKLDEQEIKIGLATVYRNLNLLTEEGMIQRLPNGLFDGNPAPHDHLYCVRCKTTNDVETSYDTALDQSIEKQGIKVFRHTIVYEGICQNCLKNEEEKQIWN